MAETGGSAERMRRKRLRDSGYELKLPPVEKERIPDGISRTEMHDLIAWSEGVWRRHGELAGESRREKSDLARLRLIASGDGS